MRWPTSFPPAAPDWMGRMRFFESRSLVVLISMRAVLYRKGRPLLEHAIIGVRTLARAVSAVGKVRGGARWVLLRVHVCLMRIERMEPFLDRMTRGYRSEAVGHLWMLEITCRDWMRDVAGKMDGRAHA
jgi:hypothetical protein